MEDSQSGPDDSSQTDMATVDHAPFVTMQRMVWGIFSAAFVGYLAFGSIEARIWSFGRLSFKERQIAHVWAYFGNHLPDMPGSTAMLMLYYLSLVVMVAGTVVGLWLFLVSDGDTADPALSVVSGSQAPMVQAEEHG